MNHLTAQTPILIATSPADFRMGIDGLAALCRSRLTHEPRSGILFVFINCNKTMIRTLAYDGTGFWLMTKRLSKGRFQSWPKVNTPVHPFEAKQLRQLLSSIQKLFGVKITASTVFDQVDQVDQVEQVCDALYPVYQYLFSLSADAVHYAIDDTTHRILDVRPIEKKIRNSDKTQLRSGVYTSGVIATTKKNQHIVLFETNIGHASELIDSILHKRNQSSAPPIIMSDALASNRPRVTTTMTSLCNSHARRQFVDVINHFPEEVEHILTRYGEIWTHDHHIAEQQWSLAERLEYHQTHSLPIMAEIKLWGETHLSDKTIEENSGLGKAIRYFIKHYEGLSLFCHVSGAKLDNNAIEAMLKIVVRDRKNAMFHKTLLGAIIEDVITSMIATGSEAGVNVMDYFTLLQREQAHAKAHPEKYLPWNYLENS